jgi:two-component system OmpR family response regulator
MVSQYRSATDRFGFVASYGPIASGGALVAFPQTARAGSSIGNLVTNESSRPTRVLLVEDDLAIQNMVVSFLEERGMRVAVASGLQEAARQILMAEPNLIIMDRRLGEEDGLDLLREIRSRSDIPVIIVSGSGCAEIDRVVGLELGADDYIMKPFGLRELVARIRAILRRRETSRAASQQDSDRVRYRFGEWQLDRRTRKLTGADDQPVALTKGEYTLLVAFLDAPQRPLSREHLLQATRVHEDVFDRSIDVQILRLRRKLESDPRAPRIIRTERGVGYVFDLPVERIEGRGPHQPIHLTRFTPEPGGA